ncbi:MAG: hypothetical protein HY510_07820 [Acidobacteria bacterium]|nr:hypothetical protein [Acidobacteriota bacterium]
MPGEGAPREAVGGGRPGGDRGRHPAIARVCFHLNGIFLLCWAVYLAGPDVSGILATSRQGAGYRIFYGAFFLLHFVLAATGIIALFVVIIELHAERPVRGFPGVIMALALPVASFLYFAARYLLQVRHWLEG